MSQHLKSGLTYINQMENKGHHRSGRQSLSADCAMQFSQTLKSQIMHAIWSATFIFICEKNTYFTFEFVSDFIVLYLTATLPVGKQRKYKMESVRFLMTSLVRVGDSQNDTYVSGVEKKQRCWPVFALYPPCSTFIACSGKK